MAILERLLQISILIGFVLLVVSKFTGMSISELVEWVNNLFRREEDE